MVGVTQTGAASPDGILGLDVGWVMIPPGPHRLNLGTASGKRVCHCLGISTWVQVSALSLGQ